MEAISQKERRSRVQYSDLLVALLRQFGTLLVVLGLGFVFALTTERFLAIQNLQNILRQISVTAVVAIGMTMVLLIGGIDLSVGSVALFSAATMNSLIFNGILPPGPAIITGLLAATLLGFVNGVLIEKARISSVIVTLGMLIAVRGLGQMILWINNSWLWINAPIFKYIKTETWFSVPVPAVIVFVLYLIAALAMKQTPLGRYIYAIGGNERAAELCGIPVTRVKILVYMLSGLCAGIGGFLLSTRLSAISPGIGLNLEFEAITAVILGGTSLSGGVGRVEKTILGAIIVGMVLNFMTIEGVSAHYQRAATGMIILAAAVLDRLSQGRVEA